VTSEGYVTKVLNLGSHHALKISFPVYEKYGGQRMRVEDIQEAVRQV
jgi:hypothetical protein